MKKTFKYIMNSRVLLIAATVSLALFGCEGDDLRDYVSPTSSGNVLSVVPHTSFCFKSGLFLISFV